RRLAADAEPLERAGLLEIDRLVPAGRQPPNEPLHLLDAEVALAVVEDRRRHASRASGSASAWPISVEGGSPKRYSRWMRWKFALAPRLDSTEYTPHWMRFTNTKSGGMFIFLVMPVNSPSGANTRRSDWLVYSLVNVNCRSFANGSLKKMK